MSASTTRLASIDAYRGLVMLLMLAEVLRCCAVSGAQPVSVFWRVLCQQQTHAVWTGCTLHDLIQPGFFFLVGVALPFSLARRQRSGQAWRSIVGHALIRAVVLVVLGMVLVSAPQRRWVWWFGDTLTQIGLAYVFLLLLSCRPSRERWIIFSALLMGYWLWFALFPLPGPHFDYATVGVTAEWLQEHGLTGFAAHWQKGSNPAWAFELWFLNLFPHETPTRGDHLGLTLLNFLPSLGTMLLGLAAGDVLRGARSPWGKVRWCIRLGLGMLLGGWLLDAVGLCPVVKTLWTPSWVLFSGGWCLLLLAGFYTLVEIGRMQWCVLPLIVIGMNSILAYSIAHLFPAFAWRSLEKIFGKSVFLVFGEAYEPLVYGAVVLLGYWLVLFALYRRRIFLRI